MRLKGKIAAITGAGSGIGRAAAEIFADEGATVVILERDEKTGSVCAESIRGKKRNAEYVQVDLTDAENVAAAFAKIDSRYGKLDALYNNAGIFLGDDRPVDELDIFVWHKIISVNLNGLFHACKYAIPLLLKSAKASIINIASSAALSGIYGCDAYTASKGAVISLTRSMAVEYGKRGIRVNCLAPAAIETPMLTQSNTSGSGFDAALFKTFAPLGRFGRPEEVALAALFLASDESSYLNGAILPLDGGVMIASIADAATKRE